MRGGCAPNTRGYEAYRATLPLPSQPKVPGERAGAVRYSFDNRSWKEVERAFGAWPLKQMEKCRRVDIVRSSEGALITIASRDK